MKKVLLSLSMLAAVMSANAQTVNVGVGAYDDFNSTTEYGTETNGMYWFTDAVWTQFYPNFGDVSGTPATPVRRTGTQMVFTVNKAADYTVTPPTTVDDNAKYSPFGLSFGDNGATPTPIDNTIDISANQTLSVDLKAYKNVTVRVQLKDVNGNTIEATHSATPANSNPWSFAVLTTMKTFTLDVSNGVALVYPGPTEGTGFNYSKVAKVLFFVDPGHAGTTKQTGSVTPNPPNDYEGFQPSTFNGAITMDNFKLGKSTNVGLGTSAAAANIASSVVYPNPATNDVKVNITLQNPAAVTMIVTDMVGKQIATKNFGTVSSLSDAVVFDASTLAKGMYTVTYVLDGTPAKTELVVVK